MGSGAQGEEQGEQYPAARHGGVDGERLRYLNRQRVGEQRQIHRQMVVVDKHHQYGKYCQNDVERIVDTQLEAVGDDFGEIEHAKHESEQCHSRYAGNEYGQLAGLNHLNAESQIGFGEEFGFENEHTQ